MKVFVTGAAGFIGSTLVDVLLTQGLDIVGYDNFSTGQAAFLEDARKSGNFSLVEGDILDLDRLKAASAGCAAIYHLAANADVRFGAEHPRKDLEQNTIGTFNVLEAARQNGIGRIAFSSTGSVYGEAAVIPTPEDAPFPVQTSLYGASKLAGEGLIAAYAEAFGIRATIFRFVSILGDRYTHGHVFDFFVKLRRDPTRLDVLGNGRQRKSYLHVRDCVSAILHAMAADSGKIAIYNLGADEYCEVRDSIGWIVAHLGVNPELLFGEDDRGWIGDNPFIFLDTKKIRSLGWKQQYSIKEGVIATLDYLQRNDWLIEARK